MSILCECVTVKIQFHRTSTCTYSIVLTLPSVTMLPRSFGPPFSKILDLPLSGIYLIMYIYEGDSYTARIYCSYPNFITSGFIG